MRRRTRTGREWRRCFRDISASREFSYRPCVDCCESGRMERQSQNRRCWISKSSMLTSHSSKPEGLSPGMTSSLTPARHARTLKIILYATGRHSTQLRQVSVTQRFDTGSPNRTGGRAEPLVPRPALHAQSPVEQDDADTSSVAPPALQGRVASFGPFRLHATERLVQKNGTPLKICSPAFHILVTLLERAPAFVSQRELIKRAWGSLVVDEANLRVHVTALRKQLGDGRSSVGYVTNVPCR